MIFLSTIHFKNPVLNKFLRLKVLDIFSSSREVKVQ